MGGIVDTIFGGSSEGEKAEEVDLKKAGKALKKLFGD